MGKKRKYRNDVNYCSCNSNNYKDKVFEQANSNIKHKEKAQHAKATDILLRWCSKYGFNLNAFEVESKTLGTIYKYIK